VEINSVNLFMVHAQPVYVVKCCACTIWLHNDWRN